MQTDNCLKRIKIRLFEGVREGTTLIKKIPSNFKELTQLVCKFLEQNSYDPSYYSLYYNDGDDSVHLQNQKDFESALDDCGKTLILELKQKTEEEMLSHSLIASPLLQYKSSLNLGKYFSFQDEIAKKVLVDQKSLNFTEKTESEQQIEEEEQNFITSEIKKQLPMLYIQNDRFWQHVDEIVNINPSYFNNLHWQQ